MTSPQPSPWIWRGKNKATLQPLRHLPISAASGLVIVGEKIYVVADDELELNVFALNDEQFHQRLTLFEGKLPNEKAARKKQKPDLEALTLLPAMPAFPHGALLALGSGSTPQRQRALSVAFNPDGSLNNKITTLDLSPLYASLPFVDINIEGAFVSGTQLVLMQRGNNSYPQSALVYCALEDLMRGLRVTQIKLYDLHLIQDVPLGFTDGLCLPDGHILFSAVAENTSDSYNDGACVGAAMGEIDTQGQLVRCEALLQAHKVEGIAMVGDVFYAVTDADDAAVPAKLFKFNLPV